jgi:F-type H+-transporting ATPase subunit alpha
MVDDRTRRVIEHGRRIRAVLTQPQFAGLAMPHQVALLLALDEGMLDPLPLEKVTEFRNSLAQWLGEKGAAPVERIRATGILDDAARTALLRLMAECIAHVGGSAAASAGAPAK